MTEIESALRRAFRLGQVYWQQADSEYTSHHKKADITLENFEILVADTLLAAAQFGTDVQPTGPLEATECAKQLLTLAKWSEAPTRTVWGVGMMVADVELSKDETLTTYVHRSVLP